MKTKIAVFSIIGLLVANFASAIALVNCKGTVASPCDIPKLLETIRLVINFLLSWAWLISILFIVYSGIRMVLAGGNEERLSTAKTSLNHAIVGFVIILVSFILINTVIGILTGGGNIIDAFRLVP